MPINLDLMNKFIMDFKEYIVGSEKFFFKYFDPNCYPIDYEFIFSNMEFYFPKFDKNNIPYSFSNDRNYNFSGISGFALANYNRYLKSRDLKYKEAFFNQIKFIESYSPESSYPSFLNFHEIDAPWFSSLSQGLVASCYIRAYLLTNNTKYIHLAKESIEFVLSYEGSQKLIKKIKNIDVTQEYPGDKVPNVLNGHLSFLIGALETNRWLCLNNEQEINLDNFLTPLKEFLQLSSKNKWTIYNVNNSDKHYNYSTINYHNLHISQTKYIAILTDSNEYDTIINNWEKGKNNLLVRLYAMFQKIRYRILN